MILSNRLAKKFISLLNRIPYFRMLADRETYRLQKFPRFVFTETNLFGKKIQVPDAASFLFIRREVFVQQIYKFNTGSPIPYIIDAGANIGLSIFYFKKLYPNAEIVAFEPDEKIFQVLENNVKVFNLDNVQLFKKGCWNREEVLNFYSEGADGGRIANDFDKNNIIKIETTSLRSFLNKKVDFLKIDIEGAETVVMNDIKDLLINVENIFIEYHSFLGKEQTLDEILAILRNAGFRYIIHHIGIYSPTPYIDIASYYNMDLQLNIFGYRC